MAVGPIDPTRTALIRSCFAFDAPQIDWPQGPPSQYMCQSTFGAAGDEIIYEVVYKNMSSETKVLKSAELYPDVTDAEVMTYGIGNVKEKDTKIKPNETLTVYVTAKVSDTATVITAPNKTYKVELEFE